MQEIHEVKFNHHRYTLPVVSLADGRRLVHVDFIHHPDLMYDAAVEANRYMNHNISNAIDVIVTPECRCITLATQLSLMNGCQIVMLRKSLSEEEENQPYWQGTYHSRSHRLETSLYLTQEKAALMDGKNVLVLDDISSTGKTLIAIHDLLKQSRMRIKDFYFSIFDEDCEKDKRLALLPSYYFLKTLPYFD